MTIFIDTNGEMDFADNERLRFVMHFLKLGSDPDVLEIRNNRFVREDAETSFQEIWLPCATAKQKEIDKLKEELEKAKAQAVPEGYVLLPRVPTEKMFQAYERYSVAPMSTLSKTGYKAMVEASESGAEG
ncbi:hypothetical protein [Acinetobacter nosocomialis]